MPAPLPPDPPITMDPELTRLLSQADRVLGRLDGIGAVRPNPDLFDYLYEQPIVNVRLVEKRLKSSFVTANKLVDQLVKLEILQETTGGQRNRRYSYVPYLMLFESSAMGASYTQT